MSLFLFLFQINTNAQSSTANLISGPTSGVRIETSVTNWWRHNPAQAQIDAINDGDISTVGSLNYQVHPLDADNKKIEFYFPKEYYNGRFEFYNRTDFPQRILHSTVRFYHRGVIVYRELILSPEEVITISADATVLFDRVELVFSGDSQNFREIKIYGNATVIDVDVNGALKLSDYELNDIESVEDGVIYYDQNFYGVDEAGDGFFEGDGGGLALYKAEDGWSALIDTKNMEFLNARFNNVIAKGFSNIGTDDLKLGSGAGEDIPNDTEGTHVFIGKDAGTKSGFDAIAVIDYSDNADTNPITGTEYLDNNSVFVLNNSDQYNLSTRKLQINTGIIFVRVTYQDGMSTIKKILIE